MKQRRPLLTAIAGLILTAGVLLAPAAAAFATQPVTTPTVTQTIHPPMAVKSSSATDVYLTNIYLPLNRWSAASTAFHDEFDTFITTQLTEKMMRGSIETLTMLAGNNQWSVTSKIVRMAVSFDVLHGAAGQTVDHSASLIGTAILQQPILLGSIITLAVTLIFAQAWRTRSGRGWPWKRFGSIVIILTIISVMTAAASQGSMSSTAGGTPRYNPPVGSPIWAATVVSDSVAQFAAVPAAAMVNWTPALTGQTNGALYSCDAYQTAMQKLSDASQVVRNSAGYWTAANTDIVSIAKIMTNLWEQTGLATWKIAQFGSANPYADYMYCRALDQNAHAITPADMNKVTRISAFGLSSTGNTPGTAGAASPIFTTPNSSDFDATLIAWAACRPTTSTPTGANSFTLAPGWETLKNPAITPGDCWNWWSATSPSNIPGTFKIGGSATDIRNRTSDPRVLDFVDTLHGSSPGAVTAGTMATITYVLSAMLMTWVFLGIALAIIIAKVFGLILVMLLFLVMILALFSRQAASERLLPLAQKFFGVTVFSFGISLILSIVCVITSLLIGIGGGFLGGPGNPVYLLWAGISPLMSVVLIHQVFKKVLKLPSPVTPTGMLAWGAAGGAAGSIIGSSLANRVGSKARGAAGQAARKAGNYALQRATGGMLGNPTARHGMDGGVRKGQAVDGLAVAGQQKLNAPTPVDVKTERKAAFAARREAQGPNLIRRGLTRAGSTSSMLAGKVALGTWGGVKTVGRYIAADGDTAKAMEARGTAAVQKGLRTARTGVQTAAQKIAAAPQATLDAVVKEGRAVGSTARLFAQAVREDPRGAARVAARATVGATNALRKSPVIRHVARTAAVAGAVALGPVGSVAAGVYLQRKVAAGLKARKTRNEGIVQTYRAGVAERARQTEAARAAAEAAKAATAAAATPPEATPGSPAGTAPEATSGNAERDK